MEFKVRPFEKAIGRSESRAGDVMKGRIEVDGYVLQLDGRRFDGARYTLPTVSVGVDERGPFAMIRELEAPIESAGWRLGIEPEYSEGQVELGIPPGCRIGIERLADARVATSAEGISPDATNLLPPIEDGISVHFDFNGCRDDVTPPSKTDG